MGSGGQRENRRVNNSMRGVGLYTTLFAVSHHGVQGISMNGVLDSGGLSE